MPPNGTWDRPRTSAAVPCARPRCIKDLPSGCVVSAKRRGTRCKARGTDALTSASTMRAARGSSRSIPIPISPTKPACRAWRRPRDGSIRNSFVASRKEPCEKRRAPKPRVSCSLHPLHALRPLRPLRPLRFLRPVGRAHPARLDQLTRATGLFREEEAATAVELFDESLAGDDDYRFVGAFDGDQLIWDAFSQPTPVAP